MVSVTKQPTGYASALSGLAVVATTTGGVYHEFWVGPLLRLDWRTLFLELGYGAFGIRSDEARDDLPAADGTTDSALLTHPGVAWLMALGGGVPVTELLQVVIRVEYRIRYYNRRVAGALQNDINHGTQNITPFIGVAWAF